MHMKPILISIVLTANFKPTPPMTVNALNTGNTNKREMEDF